MRLQQTTRNAFFVGLFLATFVLTLPLIAAAQGKIVFVSVTDPAGDSKSKIYMMNSDGTNPIPLTNDTFNDRDPSLSPDGSKIAFVSDRDGDGLTEIYVMNADGTNQTPLAYAASTSNHTPTFSPDGNKIVFSSNSNGSLATEEIYVMNSDGSNTSRLTNNTTVDIYPSFSPDGSKIVFSSLQGSNYEIYTMNADGTGQTRLTNNSAQDVMPSFSPDGSKIVFRSDLEGGNTDVYSMNSNGTNIIRLTDDSSFDTYPTFSPDGGKIAFASPRDGNYEIYVMNADGSNEVPLTNSPAADDISPSWSIQVAPTITALGATLARDSNAANLSIASVNDAEDAENSLSVTVNGSLSASSNGVTISGIAVSSSGDVTADIEASCGAANSVFTLEVTDSGNLTASATLNVTVTAENAPPAINLSSAVISLFPPNHEYKTIQVSQLVASVSDNCSTLAVGDVRIAQVTSDEADNAPGDSDGNTINDIVIADDCRSAQLRVERDGSRNGRVYTITLRLRDATGNTTTATKKISVPRSQNGNPAIDDGAAFTVSGGCP